MPVEQREPDVAVIIVNYNAGDYLLACLESVFASAGDAVVQAVVVDNDSGDDSIARARAAFPQVAFVENPDNRGFSAGVNQGIRQTRAPFLLLLNPDAEISVGSLSGLLKVARDHPRAGAVGPLIRNRDGSVYLSGRKFPTILEGAGHALLEPFWPQNPF